MPESNTLNLDDNDLFDLTLDYARNIVKGGWEGIKDTAVFFEEVVHHPEILWVPITELAYDATIIAMAHVANDDGELISENDIASIKKKDVFAYRNSKLREQLHLFDHVTTSHDEYITAMQRMKERVIAIESAVDAADARFTAASNPERAGKLSYTTTSILVPSWFVKGSGVVAKMSQNYYKYGTVNAPRVFHNVRWSDIKTPLPKVDTLLIDQVRNLPGKRNLLYVVLEDQTILISEMNRVHALKAADGSAYITKILHPELSGLQNVIGAGELTIDGGKIIALDNFAPPFGPFGPGLKTVVEKSFLNAGYAEVKGKFKLYQFSINSQIKPIFSQEGLGFGFNRQDILYGATVLGVQSQYSQKVQNKLKNGDYTAIRDDLKLRAWIATDGTKADKALLKGIDNYESLKEAPAKTDEARKEEFYKRIERIQTLKEASSALANAANLAVGLGNEGLGKVLSGAAGFTSIGAGIAAGFGWSGVGLVIGGVSMLVSAFSKRRKSKGDDGFAKALQQMGASILKEVNRYLKHYVQTLMQSNYAMHQEEIAYLNEIIKSVNFVIQQNYYQQYDLSMLRPASDLILDNQYQEILIGAKGFGEDRRTSLLKSSQTEYNAIVREYMPGLEQIIQVSYNPYHNGITLYELERSGYKEESLKDLTQLYKRGQALGYFAMSYREKKALLSQECEQVPNLILWTEALEHIVRLNALHSPDDPEGKDFFKYIQKSKALLACIESMQAHQTYLFSPYFDELLKVTEEYQAHYVYGQEVVDVVEMRHWHAPMPHNVTTHGSLQHVYTVRTNLIFHKYENKSVIPRTNFLGMIPYGEFAMLSAAGLGGFRVQYVAPKYDWKLKYGTWGTAIREPSLQRTYILSPYPRMWFEYNNGTRVDFHSITPSPQPITKLDKVYIHRAGGTFIMPKEEAWESKTLAIHDEKAFLAAIEELKMFRNQAVQAKKNDLEKNITTWNQILTRYTLKIRLLCWTLGVDLDLCKDLPDFQFNKTELFDAFKQNIDSGNQSYAVPLPEVPKQFLNYVERLKNIKEAINGTTFFMNPYYFYIQSLTDQMQHLHANWESRPHVEGVSEEDYTKQMMEKILREVIALRQENKEMKQAMYKHGLFVDATMAVYKASWHCETVGDNARCYSPDHNSIQRYMHRWVDKPWAHIDPTVHCETDAEITYCNGSEISYMEYTRQTLASSALHGAVFAFVPEAIGDAFWSTGLTSRQRVEEIKTLINFGMLLFIANCVNGNRQHFIMGYIIGVAISCLATNILIKRAGWSESNARIAGNTLGFLVNLQREASTSSDMALSAAHFVGSKIGLWAEKKVVNQLESMSFIQHAKNN